MMSYKVTSSLTNSAAVIEIISQINIQGARNMTQIPLACPELQTHSIAHCDESMGI